MAFAADGHVIDGRYRLERWIARGGFGEVWQATDIVLGRPVAVKLLRADRAADPDALARFRVEARRASGVTHENIARTFDYKDAVGGQAPFLVTEFVDGQSLAELLAEGPLTVPATLSIVAQVAAGIAAAHAAGLVNLDVKPANVLLSADGAVKVTDFGFGRMTNDEQAGEEIGCMTHAYLAPERVLGEDGGPAADLYSLGVLAHECLRGEPPFTGTPIQVAVAHQVRDLPPLPMTAPPAVAELIVELTDRDPANRPGSAAVVARRAAALRQQLVPPAPVPTAAPAALPSPAPLPTQAAPWPASSATAGQASADRAPAAQGPAHHALADRRLAVRGPAGREPADQVSAQRWRRRLALVPLAAVVVAVSAFFLAGRLDHGSLPAQNAVQAGPATVRVNGAALVNKPVGLVDSRLRRLGFVVRNRWRQSASVPVGLVIAVRPAGRLPVGSLVTVLGSGSAGDAGRVTSSAQVRNRDHRHKGKHEPHSGPSGKPGHTSTPSSPPAPTSSAPTSSAPISPAPTSPASPQPTPTVSPSPTGTPSPSPSQSPTSDPTPSGGPGGTGDPSPTASPSPS